MRLPLLAQRRQPAPQSAFSQTPTGNTRSGYVATSISHSSGSAATWTQPGSVGPIGASASTPTSRPPSRPPSRPASRVTRASKPAASACGGGQSPAHDSISHPDVVTHARANIARFRDTSRALPGEATVSRSRMLLGARASAERRETRGSSLHSVVERLHHRAAGLHPPSVLTLDVIWRSSRLWKQRRHAERRVGAWSALSRARAT